MFSFHIRCVVVASFVLVSVIGGDWPQWRGPYRTGYIHESDSALQELPRRRNVVWKKDIGAGLASPVVSQGRVIYMDAKNQREMLRVADAATGEQIWEADIDGTFRDGQGPEGPRCTPWVDGDRVYAQSSKGELQCRKLEGGELMWRVNFTNDLGARFIGEKGNVPGAVRHGNNGVPLIVGDRMYACVGGKPDNGIVCFNKHTGERIWGSQDDEAAYAPPAIAEVAGIEQLLGFTVDGVVGLRPSNGELLWRVPIETAYGRHVTVPIAQNDLVVVSSHSAGLIASRISGEGGDFKAENAWTSKDAAMNFSSPVLVGKHLYGLGPDKNLVCVDIETGELAWSKEGHFHTSAGKAHATFIVMGENILTLTDGGMLVLFKANPNEFQELGRLQVCGMNWCYPAYSDGKLYVRDGMKEDGALYCIDLTSAE